MGLSPHADHFQLMAMLHAAGGRGNGVEEREPAYGGSRRNSFSLSDNGYYADELTRVPAYSDPRGHSELRRNSEARGRIDFGDRHSDGGEDSRARGKHRAGAADGDSNRVYVVGLSEMQPEQIRSRCQIPFVSPRHSREHFQQFGTVTGQEENHSFSLLPYLMQTSTLPRAERGRRVGLPLSPLPRQLRLCCWLWIAVHRNSQASLAVQDGPRTIAGES